MQCDTFFSQILPRDSFVHVCSFQKLSSKSSIFDDENPALKRQYWSCLSSLSPCVSPSKFLVQVSCFQYWISINYQHVSLSLISVARHSSIAFRKYDYYSGALEIQDLENCTRCDPFYILTRNWSWIRILKLHCYIFTYFRCSDTVEGLCW